MTTLREKIIDKVYYSNKIFKTLIIGVVICGFAIGWDKSGEAR